MQKNLVHPELNVRDDWLVCFYFNPDSSIDPFFAITPQLINQWEKNSATEAQESVFVREADIS